MMQRTKGCVVWSAKFAKKALLRTLFRAASTEIVQNIDLIDVEVLCCEKRSIQTT